MDAVRFSQIVDEVLASLPQFFKTRLDNLAVIVQDYPEPDLQRQFPGGSSACFAAFPRPANPSLPPPLFPSRSISTRKTSNRSATGKPTCAVRSRRP